LIRNRGALLIYEKRYTYADYVSWGLKEGERYELIDGIPYAMAAPSEKHQTIAGGVFVQLYNRLMGRRRRPFIAPFDVCLFAKGDDDKTSVQPDVMVVCDESKRDGNRINGAPDFIVEVLSPSNQSHEFIRKLNQYRQAGVCEYWIIDPTDELIQVFLLEGGRYILSGYSGEDVIPLTAVKDCEIDMREVFAEANR